MPTRLVVISVFFVILASAGTAEQSRAAAEVAGPKIGLVLSGGGARGAAHLGVIKELERLRVPIDCIAGTSMGAVVGGLYASGKTSAEMEKILQSIDWGEMFNDRPPREKVSMNRKMDDALFFINKSAGFKDGKLRLPRGAIQGQKLYLLLKDLTLPVADITDFDSLPIPFRAVASDIASGDTVVLDSGDLAGAIRASMSIPGGFAPMEIAGRLLVDGGVSNNLPVDVAREMGAEVLIVVDISTPLLKKESLDSMFALINQLTGLLTRRNTEQQLATLSPRDVLIVPDMGSISTLSFTRTAEAAAIGVEAARKKEAALLRFSRSEGSAPTPSEEDRARRERGPMVEFVRLENDSDIADEVILAKLHIPTGQPLDTAALEQDLAVIYGMDVFESVTYSHVKEDGRSGVKVHVKQKPWGPNYFQLGLRFSTDFGAHNNLAFRLGYLRTPLNRFNAEWRSIMELGEEYRFLTELYQPLGMDSPYFVRPRLFYTRPLFNIYRDEQLVAEYRVSELGAELAVGRELGTWGRLQLGITRFGGQVKRHLGQPLEPEGSIDGGQGYASLHVDTLDNIFFPRSGFYGDLKWIGSSTELDADSDFQQVLGDLLGVHTWGKHTLFAGARYYSTYQGQAPLQSRFRLGGLFELPGFAENEMSGQQEVLLRVGYLRPLGLSTTFSTYAGLALHYGATFEDRADIAWEDMLAAGSIYIGLDSALGPLYLGYGHAETGNSSVYLMLAKPFY